MAGGSGLGLLTRLVRLDTSAVSDALDSLEKCGVVTSLVPLFQTGRIAGRVVTTSLAPVETVGVSRSHLGAEAIEAAKPGDIIVVDNAGRTSMAAWGGNLALGARLKGIAALIVHGCIRDREEIEDSQLPTFCRGVTPRTARGRIAVESVNEPVEIDGVRVTPGDFAIADRTGVAFIAASEAEEIIGIAEGIVSQELQVADQIRAGAPVTSAMGAAYENILKEAR